MHSPLIPLELPWINNRLYPLTCTKP
jgi:hypothetical protein